jgi:hypothetical protein
LWLACPQAPSAESCLFRIPSPLIPKNAAETITYGSTSANKLVEISADFKMKDGSRRRQVTYKHQKNPARAFANAATMQIEAGKSEFGYFDEPAQRTKR